MAENEQDLGKFKSVDALLKAYEELEAEFTRRSQRLKALEESEQRKAEEKPSKELKRQLLEELLQSQQSVPLLEKAGTGVTVPVSRPKSFAEAGSLALDYFKSEQ